LWTLALAMYAYCVLPVDWLTTSYNVRRILAGDPAPSVQLSVHPLTTEGLLPLRPLLASNNLLIRDGVGSMLAIELERLDAKFDPLSPPHWTEYQIAERELHDDLTGMQNLLAPYRDPRVLQAARAAFDTYAYQWY
jgi:hypothetical protein